MSFAVSSVYHAVRRASAVALVSLAAVSGTPVAAAPVTYDITFITSDATKPTGSFTYDDVEKKFTDFLVLWNGKVFDEFTYTSATNNCPAGPEGMFLLLRQRCGEDIRYSWFADTDEWRSLFLFVSRNNRVSTSDSEIQFREPSFVGDEISASGGWFINERISVPEPGSLALALLSLGSLGLVHRRYHPRKAILG